MSGRIREYMETDFITVVPSETLAGVLDKMIENETEICIVLESGQNISSVVIATQIIAKREQNLSNLVISDHASRLALITMQQDHFMEDAAQLFVEFHNVDEIVILDNFRPVGVLTKRNVLRWIKEKQKPKK